MRAERTTKKSKIIKLFQQGHEDIFQLSLLLNTRPSYIAQVLQAEGLLKGYYDLYTTSTKEINIYSTFFKNVLSFKSLEAAKESIEKIEQLFTHFEKMGDRAGQHQAMVIALTGKNRARWSGKTAEADVFDTWLKKH